MILRRHFLFLILLLGTLIAQQAVSVAHTGGSELVEGVTADTVGEDAYVVVADVSAFAPSGGDAVFEPGSPNEEVFSYSALDHESGRLVGLVRPSPIAHPVGAFVSVGSVEPATEPETTPRPPTPSDDASPTSGDDARSPEPDPLASAPLVVAVEIDDGLGGQEGIDEPTEGHSTERSTCWTTRPLVDCVSEAIDGACDPNDSGQTCQDVLAQLIGDPVDDLCDPHDTGQTCNEWLAQLIDDDPEIDPCPAQTVEECAGVPEVNLDPEDLLLDDLYNSLLDEPGDCDVKVDPPVKFQNSGTGIWFVGSYGVAECPEYDEVEVTTCIQIKTPEGWKRKNCAEGPYVGNKDEASVVAPCYKTHKYRTKFTWQAMVSTSALDGATLEDAPSSGTKKTPLTGVKITCPDP